LPPLVCGAASASNAVGLVTKALLVESLRPQLGYQALSEPCGPAWARFDIAMNGSNSEIVRMCLRDISRLLVNDEALLSRF
jgi:hypothetical protein